jgi:hypothetical protein
MTMWMWVTWPKTVGSYYKGFIITWLGKLEDNVRYVILSKQMLVYIKNIYKNYLLEEHL